MNRLLSFVVIEYHSLTGIDECIASITQAVNNLSYEIIVSSNSLYPESECKKIIQERDNPNVKWIFNEKNGGFAYGMNQGLKNAVGKYRVIMNPDVKILKGLSSMIRFMEEHTNVGAIAPKIVSPDGEIQDSCRPYVSVPNYLIRSFKRIIEHKTAVLPNSINYNLVQTVDWVIGAFIMVRDEIVRLTGGLDEHYFMYAEDLDWCTRIRQFEYEIVYYPKAKIEYMGSRSARKSLKYAKIFFDSHLYYWRKFGFVNGYPKRRELLFESDFE